MPNELDPATSAEGPADVPLFRTATGDRLHVRQCPHLLDKVVLPASAADLASHEVCAMCRKELAGEGRTAHETIEAALQDIGAPRHNSAELARLLAVADFDAVHVPYSRSYVAVTRRGRAVAWAGKTYVDYADREMVQLPDYAPGGGGGAARPDESWGTAVCPDCFTRKSINGSCLCA